jgi:hypothetical protein
MFSSSKFAMSQSAVLAGAFAIHALCGLNGQGFTARSSNLNPFGVNGQLPFGEMPSFIDGKGIKGGFGMGLGLSTMYDSNVLLTENNPESAVSMSFSAPLSYTTDPEGGAPMVITASYSPSANVYFDNSDFNSFDQSGSLGMIYSASKTTISAFAGVTQDSGADSLAASQGFFTGTAVSLGLQVTYQLAPRTSVNAGLSSSITDYGAGSFGSSGSPGGFGSSGAPGDSAVGFTNLTGTLGGLWAATERFSFGPSLSYSTNLSDSVEDFDSWGFSMVGSYKASERIQVAASMGFAYTEFSASGASSDISPTGSLSASYQINELWSWNTSIQSGISPSPTGSNFVINGWSVTSNLNRQLLIGSAGVGLLMDFSNYQSAGPTGVFQASQEDQQNIALLLNYSRPLPLFNDRLGFASSFIYTVNYGDFEYTQIQVTAGLNLAF